MSGFKKVFHEKIHLGDVLETPNHMVFFGSRFGTLDLLQKSFSGIKFCRLKQVHGNIVVEADPSLQHEGDGHWTAQNNLALSIVTADCIPALGVSGSGENIFAVHAGWRGVSLNILNATISKIPDSDRSGLQLYVGPHILKNSFEVGMDVAETLAHVAQQNDLFERSQVVLQHPTDKSKALVDLLEITKLQAATCGVNTKNIIHFGPNTFTSEQYSSYRREKPNAGRQISFICKI